MTPDTHPLDIFKEGYDKGYQKGVSDTIRQIAHGELKVSLKKKK